MRRIGNVVVSLLMLGSLAACVTQGRDFSSDISWIKVGKTTQSDVIAILGSPERVGNAGGTPTWSYGYYDYHLMSESFTKEVKLYWSNDNTVKDYSFTSSFPGDRSKDIYLQQKR